MARRLAHSDISKIEFLFVDFDRGHNGFTDNMKLERLGLTANLNRLSKGGGGEGKDKKRRGEERKG
jgi:hypothetical protein